MSEGEPRRRRVPIRWLSLAEAVAVAAVAISALSLYNSWHERSAAPPAAAPPAAATRAAAPLTLRASADRDGTRLSLAPVAAAQIIQSQAIAFPKALGVAAVETTGDPRIEAGWIDDALRRAADDAKPVAGDRRVPVLVTTRYIEDGAERVDTALYQLGYALSDGGLFDGRDVRLRGLSLVARRVTDGPRRLDAMWPAAR